MFYTLKAKRFPVVSLGHGPERKRGGREERKGGKSSELCEGGERKEREHLEVVNR